MPTGVYERTEENGRKGFRHSEETKRKMSMVNKGCRPPSFLGRRHTEETKKKISLANSGRKQTEEHKRKNSQAQKGKIVSVEARKNMSLARMGWVYSEETKRKIGLTSLGRKHTEESKKKMRLASLGRKHTEESKKKMGLRQIGDKNKNWIEELDPKKNYGAIHKRIRNKYGKASKCEFCGTLTAKKYEWSNKDHKYSLIREDWQETCTFCHRRYDMEQGIEIPAINK